MVMVPTPVIATSVPKVKGPDTPAIENETTVKLSPSTSLSLVSIFPEIEVFCGVVMFSSFTTGASFTAETTISKDAGDDKDPSLTVYPITGTAP